MTLGNSDITKMCAKCGRLLPATAFYQRSSGKLRAACKRCDAAVNQAYRRSERGKERNRESRRRRYWADVETQRARGRAKSKTYLQREDVRERQREQKRAARRSPTEGPKQRALDAVKYALKTGRLVRGSCERCGKRPGHAYHDDYSRPLVVRWLCPACHRQHHMLKDRADKLATALAAEEAALTMAERSSPD